MRDTDDGHYSAYEAREDATMKPATRKLYNKVIDRIKALAKKEKFEYQWRSNCSEDKCEAVATLLRNHGFTVTEISDWEDDYKKDSRLKSQMRITWTKPNPEY